MTVWLVVSAHDGDDDANDDANCSESKTDVINNTTTHNPSTDLFVTTEAGNVDVTAADTIEIPTTESLVTALWCPTSTDGADIVFIETLKCLGLKCAFLDNNK